MCELFDNFFRLLVLSDQSRYGSLARILSVYAEIKTVTEKYNYTELQILFIEERLFTRILSN